MSARVCVLTPQGRGAVAVVAIEGDSAVGAVDRYFQAANGRALAEQSMGRIVYGHWGGADGEDLVVSRREETRIEVHCHGGNSSSAAIVADLVAAGCVEIDSGEWVVVQHDCPITAAAHLALAKATTTRTARILLDQYHGALRREMQTIDLALERGETAEARSRLQSLLDRAALGRHLTKPWQVVIAGEPNVGKSSLINALVGYERAIVFDQPGTTRDVVSSTTAIDGWPVQLSDTAGLHEATDAIETAGIELARQRAAAADLVVWVLDATARAGDSWNQAQQQAQAVGVALNREQTQLVINKTDLAKPSSEQTLSSIGTCAVSGAGTDKLLNAISNRLVPTVPPPGEAVPFTEEQIELVAEKFRETGTGI